MVKPKRAGVPQELRFPSPFPDYTPAFDNHTEDHFADLCVFLRSEDERPLLLHRTLLTRASHTFAALFRKKQVGTASYDPVTQCVRGLPQYGGAMVSLLRFCYGDTLTVTKDNVVPVVGAFTFLKMRRGHQYWSQIREYIWDITEGRAAEGLALVRQGAQFDRAYGTAVSLGASIAKLVFPLVSIETDFQALTSALSVLPPEYLDAVDYSDDESQKRESDLRIAYIQSNRAKLTSKQVKKILAPLRLPKLPIRNVLQLASLGLCSSQRLMAVIRKLHDGNKKLQRKLAASEKARNKLAKRVKGDDESGGYDAESAEDIVPFALAYNRFRRLFHSSCLFHFSDVPLMNFGT